MSVFNFINESHSKRQSNGSSSLASLADLVYEEQQRSQSPVQRTGTQSRSSNLGSPLQFQPERSAFSFIASSSLNIGKRSTLVSAATAGSDQQTASSNNSNSNSQTDLAFAPRSPRKYHAAMTHLSAESTWKRIQAEKEREQSLLQRYYNRRTLVNKQLVDLQVQDKELEEALQLAIREENYVEAESVRLKHQNVTSKQRQLASQVMEEIDAQIHQSWEALIALASQEHEAMIKMVDACKSVREEKERNYLQYQIDCDRKYEHALQESSQARSKIDQEKSAIAFDLEIWEQTRQELLAKENDLVQEERNKRKEIVAQVDHVQAEIDELQRRLTLLTQKRDEYQAQLARLDELIDRALSQFAPEREALDADYAALEKRKESVASRAAELDAKDEQLHRQMTLQKDTLERDRRELQGLDDQAEAMSRRIHASQTEASFLTDTFRTLIQARDNLIGIKRSTLAKAQGDLNLEKKRVEEIQQAVYASLCKLEECERSVSHFRTVLTGLQRRKEMAVKAGQLQNAAQLQAQIKDTEGKLKEAETFFTRQQEELEADKATLDAAQTECDALRAKTEQLKEQCSAEIISLLEESRAALVVKVQQEDHPFLQTLLQLEIESVDLQIKCYGVNRDTPSAVQLLAL